MPLIQLGRCPKGSTTVSEQQNNNPESENPAAPSTEGLVSKADLDRALADLHKFKSRANDAEAKVKAIEESRLAEKEDWKSLAERREAEAKEANEKAQRIQDSYLGEKKHTAVREAALKLGMRPEAIGDLDLFSLDGVVIETTDKGVKVVGADAFVQSLKNSRPYLFGQGAPISVNSTVPGVKTGTNATVSETDILKVAEQARKTGDYSQYQALLNKYRAQKK